MLCTPFLARCWTGFHPHFWWQPYPLFKTIQTLGHFSMFFLNHFGCFIPRGCLSPMPASLAGLLLLVTYLILAILYFFEGAGKDHSLAVLEWLAAFSSHVFHTTPRKDTSDQWTFFFFKNSSRIFVYIYIHIFITGMICWNGDCNILEASEFLSWSSRFGIARDEGDNVYLVPKSQPILLRDGIGDIGKWLGVIYHPTLETLSFQVENSVPPLFGLVSLIMTLLVSRHRSKSMPEWHWWHRTSHHSGWNLSRTKTVQRRWPAA